MGAGAVSSAGAPRAAGGEDGRLPHKEGRGRPWPLERKPHDPILLAQLSLRLHQGSAPGGAGGQRSRTWSHSLRWQSQLRVQAYEGASVLALEAQGAHPLTQAPSLRGVAVLGAASVHSARKCRFWA